MTDTDLFLFLVWYTCSIDNDMDPEHGPASKKRKTASVIVDQPAESDKMVVDQVTDVSATFEEVCTLFSTDFLVFCEGLFLSIIQ